MLKAQHTIAIALFALLLLVYGHTSSVSVSWKNFSEDSGDLLACAYILGIPHPTGYPLYVLVGRVFSMLMPGSIAFSITLVSIFAAAVAGVLLFLTLTRLLPDRNGLICALLGSLSLAFSLHYWSQAVVAEVYALHMFFLAAVSLLVLDWVGRNGHVSRPPDSPEPELLPNTRTLLLAAYVLGLSFANHMLSVLTLAFALILLVGARRGRRVSLRLLAWCALFFLAAVTLYAYLPLRSARNPELDWGNPQTWTQFKWVVTGAQYRFRLLAAPFSESLSKLWPGPFLAGGWLLFLLSAAGLILGKLSKSLRTALLALIGLDLLTVLLYDIPDPPAYFLPASFALSFGAAFGAHGVVSALERPLGRMLRPRWSETGTLLTAVALTLACVLPAAIQNARRTDVSADLVPYVFGRATFMAVEPNALIVSEYDGRTFALWFFRETEFRETHSPSAIVYKYLLVWPWYVDNLRRLHPDLVVPEAGPADTAMLSLVSSNLAHRPVYTVRDDPVLAPLFTLTPVLGGNTPLYKVEAREPKPNPREGPE